jgi:hypothetical protein
MAERRSLPALEYLEQLKRDPPKRVRFSEAPRKQDPIGRRLDQERSARAPCGGRHGALLRPAGWL